MYGRMCAWGPDEDERERRHPHRRHANLCSVTLNSSGLGFQVYDFELRISGSRWGDQGGGVNRDANRRHAHLVWAFLITQFVKEVSLLLPHPCHLQNYHQSMFQLSSGSEGCPCGVQRLVL